MIARVPVKVKDLRLRSSLRSGSIFAFFLLRYTSTSISRVKIMKNNYDGGRSVSTLRALFEYLKLDGEKKSCFIALLELLNLNQTWAIKMIIEAYVIHDN